MDLKKLVEALDSQVLAGDILGAFDKFFADDVKTHSSANDATSSKSQKAEALRWFFSGVSKINRIERPAFVVTSDDTTESQFVFDFTNAAGNSLIYNEVIRRTWKDGKVVEEQYLLDQNLSAPKTKAEKKADASKAEEKAQPAAAAAPKKTAAPKAAKTEAAAPAAAPAKGRKKA